MLIDAVEHQYELVLLLEQTFKMNSECAEILTPTAMSVGCPIGSIDLQGIVDGCCRPLKQVSAGNALPTSDDGMPQLICMQKGLHDVAFPRSLRSIYHQS